MQLKWDYTNLAKAYLKRPDYSEVVIDKILDIAKLGQRAKICDIGAGVAHLTIQLLKRGFMVDAIEPNEEMRKYGKERTKKYSNIRWFIGTGEATSRPSQIYDMVTFGSSFNVCDRKLALIESSRILKSKGWFVCMWNHRDLDDPLQSEIEAIIKHHIKNYSYGTRREDQRNIIKSSGLFLEPMVIEERIVHRVSVCDWIEAWRSHATLKRQAKEKFPFIIEKIEELINGLDVVSVPYITRAYIAQKAN